MYLEGLATVHTHRADITLGASNGNANLGLLFVSRRAHTCHTGLDALQVLRNGGSQVGHTVRIATRQLTQGGNAGRHHRGHDLEVSSAGTAFVGSQHQLLLL